MLRLDRPKEIAAANDGGHRACSRDIATLGDLAHVIHTNLVSLCTVYAPSLCADLIISLISNTGDFGLAHNRSINICYHAKAHLSRYIVQSPEVLTDVSLRVRLETKQSPRKS